MNVQKPGEAAKGSESQDLERVRDLLFGGQVRDIDARLRALEDDLKAKLASATEAAEKARAELESRLAGKVEEVKNEVGSVKKDLDGEKDAREKAITSEKDAREKAVKEAAEKARTSLEDVEKRFTKITDQMEEGKPDRSELAQLFRNLAAEVAGDEQPRAAAGASAPKTLNAPRANAPSAPKSATVDAEDFFRELQADGSR